MLKQYSLLCLHTLLRVAVSWLQRTVAILAMSLSPHLGHAAEPFSYKAARLGTSTSQFLLANPEFKCLPPAGAVINCISTTSTYAGLNAEKVIATFLEGALSSVQISLVNGPDESVAHFAYGATEEALSGKHGSPLQTSDRLGGLQRSIRIWTSEKSTIQLSLATNGSVHIVGVMIYRDDHWQRSVDLRRSRAKGDI